MKIRLYILCHDDMTYTFAYNEYKNYDWAKPIIIRTTMLLENIMYDEWLLDNECDWNTYDYVGTISWKTSQKINIKDVENLMQMIGNQELNYFDMIPFFFTKENLIEQALVYHPKFKILWIRIMQELGITQETAVDKDIRPFYCNYWMCKPKHMYAYIEFFKDTKTVLETCADIQEDLWSDALYVGTLCPVKCIELYNKPYIPYHVFIYERLPCIFFFLQKINMFGS